MKMMNGKILEWERAVAGDPPRDARSLRAACDAFFARRGIRQKTMRDEMAYEVSRARSARPSASSDVRRDKEAA